MNDPNEVISELRKIEQEKADAIAAAKLEKETRLNRQKEGNEKIALLLKDATKNIAAAEAIADEYDLTFYYDVGGKGLTYTPAPKHDDDWESSSCFGEDDNYGWTSSSDHC